jgi:prevent-host-death family protein
MWSVQDAKSHLSELMRRARAGEPQTIGTRDGCVLISAEEFARLNAVKESAGEPKLHLGQWLLANSPGIEDFVLPERGRGRPDPFEGFWDEKP